MSHVRSNWIDFQELLEYCWLQYVEIEQYKALSGNNHAPWAVANLDTKWPWEEKK